MVSPVSGIAQQNRELHSLPGCPLVAAFLYAADFIPPFTEVVKSSRLAAAGF